MTLVSPFTMPAHNVTLYAVWQTNTSDTYTVTYHGNTNTGGTAPVDAVRYAQGATVTLKNKGDLVKTGYAFKEWNTKADGTGTAYQPNSTFTMPGRNVDLYAIWMPIAYTVTYDGNGNTGGAAPVDADTYVQGATVTLKDKGDLVKDGYTFIGWAESGGAVIDTVTFTMPGNNVTLYAVWQANAPSYIVTYDANGGRGSSVDNNTYLSGELVIVMGRGTVARSGYSFSGWNTLANGTGTTYYPNSTFIITGNTTFYAIWSKDSGGGGGGGGTTPTEPTTPPANPTTPTDPTTPTEPTTPPTAPTEPTTPPANPTTPTDPTTPTEPTTPPTAPTEPTTPPGTTPPVITNPDTNTPIPVPEFGGGENSNYQPTPDGGYTVRNDNGTQIGRLTPNNNGGYILIDNNDVPLGEWNIDEPTNTWIYEAYPPLAGLPVTGGNNGIIILFCCSLITVAFGLVFRRRKNSAGLL